MSAGVVTWIALAVAVVGAVWAGLLVVAEEAPSLRRTLGDVPPKSRGNPTDRTILIARLTLILIAAVAGAEAVGWWYRPALTALAAAGLVWGFLYVLADALPRAAGVLSPRLATAAVPIAARSLAPFRPLLRLVAWLEGLLASLLPPKPSRGDRFGPAHRDLLRGVFSLSDTTVAEVMTPRLDILAVETRARRQEILELLRRSEHGRIPVYTDDLDNIVGILYAKDLTPTMAGVARPPARWQELVRPATFVPESKSLAAQLKDFQRGPARLAIVVDEFGGTSGLITLEDVLEEVVGEIHGEYDHEERQAIEREGDDRFWVDGSAALDEVSHALGAFLEREDVSTVGGLIYSELGRVPQPGEELQIADFRVVVEQVVRRRIRRVYFERQPQATRVEGLSERDQ